MNIGIVGVAGRMGRMLVETVKMTEGCWFSGGTEPAGSDFIGLDIGLLTQEGIELGPVITDDAAALFAASDAVIDFTVPVATAAHAALAAKTGTALVIGTTGLDAAQQQAVDAAAENAPVVQAANFSVGVNLLLGLVEKAASVLPDAYDIEVLEMHHHHKVDSPSGTALALGEAAAVGRGVNLDDVACKARDGIIGARPKGEIGFATLRGGDVIGDHTVMYAGPGERVEITHKASSRSVFATGAVRAAMWAAGQQPGKYAMKDVLGF